MLEWLKKLPSWLYTLFTMTLLGFGIRHYRRRMLGANARMTVDVELAKIEAAKRERATLDANAVEQAAQVAYYDQAIEASKREVVAAHESVEGLDAKAISDRFAKLGL